MRASAVGFAIDYVLGLMALRWWSCSQRSIAAASKMAGQSSRDQQLKIFFERKPKIILGTQSASRKGELPLIQDREHTEM